MKLFVLNENEAVCANCERYHQHYGLRPGSKRYVEPINCGHCVYPRIKDRKPGTAACEHYIARCDQ